MATQMHIHEAGTPGAPAVVLLHGAGASGLMWRDHMARLQDRFHCLAPDLPGFGASNRLAPLAVDETADLVADLLRQAIREPEKHLHILVRMGGYSAQFALLSPQLQRDIIARMEQP